MRNLLHFYFYLLLLPLCLTFTIMYNPNKPQIFFVDVNGNYRMTYFTCLQNAVDEFRRLVRSYDCLLCDLRYCGSSECLASFRNYKYLKIKGL